MDSMRSLAITPLHFSAYLFSTWHSLSRYCSVRRRLFVIVRGGRKRSRMMSEVAAILLDKGPNQSLLIRRSWVHHHHTRRLRIIMYVATTQVVLRRGAPNGFSEILSTRCSFERHKEDVIAHSSFLSLPWTVLVLWN